jgi:DNA-binding CsgD family transcriptional regulator/tetratricopeptide (TPR) repeat protein
MVIDAASERATALQLAGRGEVARAIGALRRAATASDDPEDRLLLGKLAYVATDFAEGQQQLEHAYREFQLRGLPRRAAMAATALGQLHFDGLEYPVVGRAWLVRAFGLLEREEPCVEKGYAVIGLMGASVASAEELDASARIALDLAHRFQDRNLECKALGDSGLALVSMGRIQNGMARLDEAFTMIVGGDCRDPAVISQVVCGMLSACERCGDAARAESWLRFIEKSSPRPENVPALHIFAHCLSAYGSLLCQAGRWIEAETALRMGLARGEGSFRHLRLATRTALADLWIRQGRLDEAARLIAPTVDRVEIMGPRARLYLAQRRYDLAAAVARQALRQLGGDQIRSASLLLTLVEAELGQGHVAAAGQAAAQLQQLSMGAELPAVMAQAALATGKTSAVHGETELAGREFEAGLAALRGDSWPLLRATLYLELAHARASLAPAEAIVNAQTALTIYQRVGAPEAAVAADLLRVHGVPVTVAPPPGALAVLSRREREVLALVAQGMSNPAVAKRLTITEKTAEHHVSSILGKLGLRNRTEAAAFAASFHISEAEGFAAR